MSQADVGAKAILVSSGKVLVAENAFARKSFDTTGALVLEKAAEALAGELIVGIDDFLSRGTVDYHLILLNITHSQSLTLQDALRVQVHGVEQVTERGFITNVLELDVRVKKTQDLTFREYFYPALRARPRPLRGDGTGRADDLPAQKRWHERHIAAYARSTPAPC